MLARRRDPEGRAERLEGLFERYYRPVAGFFANRGFTDDECRDLTQETFLSAFKGLEGFRAESNFETWLFKIAANIWRNELRARSALKRSGTEVPLDDAGEPGGPPAASPRAAGKEDPLEEVLLQERMERFREAVESLPKQMRRCLFLYFDQGLKYREIAVVMDVSLGTVKSLLSQAKARLQRLLTGDGS